ncbi:sugar ABC transporter ATP-binding protein [Actinobacteria bacterium YIM 96077]|uniref:Sugar ABC transporter ATP-binding protein n=1 Tax=Phytoactinopolyspora halophila TaxID=1981511 RepID=A0A329QED1_9ACTN|nr:ATP-binding cassette domain-containing protein [Phytoactinopolyspora halophila]AYY13940.1 sugar ABC transporter ATP-binding protein [Actinobacteria bacterium YIM 96077]RAW10069.1 sugar ABC transporter ATP-binding protein [Phytoactinopolyspora halophila]
MTPLLELRNVSKHFGHAYALEGVNMSIRPGEVLSLLGDNGAGKSTLVKVVAGVHQPDEGEVYVRGERVSHWNPAKAREQRIETVFQDKALAAQQPVTSNVFLGREITNRFGFVKHRAQRQEADRLMRGMRFTSKVLSPDSPVQHLSGGEREGVAIARAVHFNADLIVLDEPTTALSLRQAQEVLDFVRRVRDDGTSVLFISHNMFHAHEVADRIVILDRGRVGMEADQATMSATELIELMQSTARGDAHA